MPNKNSWLKKTIFADINWKNLLKDFGRFYLYLLILYGLAFILVKTYLHFTLEGFLDSEEFLTGTKDFNSYHNSLEFLSKATGTYMFILACFGVFFSIPPKRFKHVALVTILISLTANMPIFYQTFAEWFMDNFYLGVCVLAAWLSSLAWAWLKGKIHQAA